LSQSHLYTISIKQNTDDKVALTLRLTFVCFQKVGLPCSIVGVGAVAVAAGAGVVGDTRAAGDAQAPEPHQILFYPEPDSEPNKNDAAQQHC
jgi:hypothetical protein